MATCPTDPTQLHFGFDLISQFVTHLVLWELRVEPAVAVAAEVERVSHPLGSHHLYV